MSKEATKRSILIIDDDKLFCDSTKEYLSLSDLDVHAVHTGAEGLEACGLRRYDVVLLDQNLPDTQGHLLCPQILETNDQTKIIFITAHPSYHSAVEALRVGAFDYLSKPFEPEELKLAVDKALRTLALEDVELLSRYRHQKEGQRAAIIGSDGGLNEVARLVSLAASSVAPVLITGETGTGKNVAAKAIHYSGERKNKPFISVNCAALPENLIEAELFGHEKGTFTGAFAQRRGVFEMATGGTLFLDEIGELPLNLQAKLLGVLEEKEVRRLGSESTRPVDVHVIAATAADLEEVIDRSFRRDLYFRLSVVRIHVPPLREHLEDIPTLVEHFLGDLAGSSRKPTIPPEEYERLKSYDWPGNIRELKNVIERALILQHGPVLRPSQLLSQHTSPAAYQPPSQTNGQEKSVPPLAEVEKEYIEYALDALDHNYTHTAKALGIAISTLKRKIRKYELN